MTRLKALVGAIASIMLIFALGPSAAIAQEGFAPISNSSKANPPHTINVEVPLLPLAQYASARNAMSSAGLTTDEEPSAREAIEIPDFEFFVGKTYETRNGTNGPAAARIYEVGDTPYGGPYCIELTNTSGVGKIYTNTMLPLKTSGPIEENGLTILKPGYGWFIDPAVMTTQITWTDECIRIVSRTTTGVAIFDETFHEPTLPWLRTGDIDISTAKVEPIADQAWVEGGVTPEPVITLDGVVLKKNTDYLLSYSNYLNPGSAAVIITGIGKYTGTLTVSYVIIADDEDKDDESEEEEEEFLPSYEGACGENARWHLQGGVLTLSGTGEMYEDDRIDAPTSLPWEWDRYRDEISTIRIGEGITTIGAGAFRDCSHVTSIELPNTVKSIGDYAFAGLPLETIELPTTVEKIGFRSFYGCTALTAVSLPASGCELDALVFENCTSLNHIKLPANTKTIETAAEAYANTSYKDVRVKLDTFGSFARSNLVSIDLDASTTAIGNALFQGCSTLNNIELPSSLRTIGEYAFAYCTSLEYLSVPEGVVSIGNMAFGACQNLTALTMPASVTSLDNIFGEASIDYGVSFSDDLIVRGYENSYFHAWYTLGDGYGRNACTPGRFVSNGTVDPFVLDEGALDDSIHWSIDTAFTLTIEGTGSLCWQEEWSDLYDAYPWEPYHHAIKRIVFSDGITHTGDHTFASSPALLKVTFGANLETVGKSAFANCPNLSNVAFPAMLKNIDVRAFEDCAQLQAISVKLGLEEIAFEAFKGCDRLQEVRYQGTSSAWQRISIDEGNDALAHAQMYYENVTEEDGVQSISMDCDTKIVRLTDGEFEMSATVEPADAFNAAIAWSSSNTSVATVDASGVVIPLSGGTTVISATAGGLSARCALTVIDDTVETVSVESVSLDPTTCVLTGNETRTLVPTILPANASNKGVTWSTSDASVVAVSNIGAVTPIARGTATITVTTVDGGKTASCAIIVNDAIDNERTVASEDALTVDAGKSISFAVQYYSSITGELIVPDVITWAAADTGVATVSGSGLTAAITGVNKGDTLVQMHLVYGNEERTVTVPVTVKAVTGNTYPEPIVESTEVVQVECSSFHSGALKGDGTLWMWGANQFGQIGNGDEEGNAVLSPVKVLDDVRSFALGDYFSAAVTKDGSLWTWGHNDCGQLADGTTVDSFVPKKVMNDVLQVSIGGSGNLAGGFAAAVKNDHTLWMWGNNYNGQLGNGKYWFTEENTHHSTPFEVLSNVASVSCGYESTAAIKTNGDLWMWGHSESIWDPNEIGEAYEPQKVFDHVKCASWCKNARYASIVRDDDSLWMWGVNGSGQLGVGDDDYSHTAPQLVLESVEKVDCGGNTSGALKKDGSLWVWGSNFCGLYGNGSTDNSLSPIMVTDDVKDFAIGWNHSLVVKNDGSLWGSGAHSNIGIGSEYGETKEFVPVTLGGDNNELSNSISTTVESDVKGEVLVGKAGDALPDALRNAAFEIKNVAELDAAAIKGTFELGDGGTVRGVYDMRFVDNDSNAEIPWSDKNSPIELTVRIKLDDETARLRTTHDLTMHHVEYTLVGDASSYSIQAAKRAMDTSVSADGYLTFKTNHFSTYALTATLKKAITNDEKQDEGGENEKKQEQDKTNTTGGGIYTDNTTGGTQNTGTYSVNNPATTSTAGQSTSGSTSGLVQTGDATAAVIIALGSLAAAGAVVIVRRRKMAK